jgi:DNA-binding transcriptional regulator YhcF (GntR family)
MNHPLPATPATERALAAYRAIRHFFEKEDRLPNYGELARSLGVHTTTAQHRFGELVRCGLLEKRDTIYYRFSRDEGEG